MVSAGLQALVAGLLAFSPELLLVADAGANDLSGHGHNPIASASGNSTPTIAANTFTTKAAYTFNGTQGWQIPPFAAKHWFIVLQTNEGVVVWPDYYAAYLSGSGGVGEAYTFVGNFGSGTGDLWVGLASGTWDENGDVNLIQNSREIDEINVHEVSLTVATQALINHHFGEFPGTVSRNFQGSVFCVVAFPDTLSSGNRTTVVNLLRDYFRKPLIVCAGDSLTNGAGATSLAYAYPTQLRGLIGRTLANAWSAGYNGATISQMDTVAAAAVDLNNPNTIVFWGGTNNVGLSSQTAVTAFSQLVTYCTNRRASLPSARLFVCTLRPSTTLPASNPANYDVQAPLFNSMIVADSRFTSGALANGIVRVDQIPQLQDPNDTTYTTDGLHLTNAGYALVAQAVQAVIGGAS